MCLLVIKKNSNVLIFDIKMERLGFSFIRIGINIVVLNIVIVCWMFIIVVWVNGNCLFGVIMLFFVEVDFNC